MQTFVAYLSLEDFRRAMLDGRTSAEAIHVQARSTQPRGPFPAASYSITVSAVLNGMAHIGQISIEAVDLVGPDRHNAQIMAGCADRAETAQALVEAYFTDYHPGVTIARGIVLVPGLLAELPRLHTSQNLWRITTPAGADRSDPYNRTLIRLSGGGPESEPELILA